MQGQAIKRIEVKGLHQHLDINVEFKPGLNVVYGKNGKGKTTILHILANILELDFNRFRYLQFSSVLVENFSSNVMCLNKDPLGRLRIFLDGNEAGTYDESNKFIPQMSPAERQAIKSAFGGRPVYLPAFRAILERVRSSSYDASERNQEYNEIKASELQAIKESALNASIATWRAEEGASLIARKTIQCRDWFGPFVPVIRYPSLIEVSESISSEYMDAQVEVYQSDRRMLSSMFVDVFKVLVSNVQAPSDEEVDTLMERVRQSLDIEDKGGSSFPYSDDVSARLAEEVYKAQGLVSSEQSAAQRRVLKLYAEMLERRNQERVQAFSKVKKFENSINLFLDGKKIRVSDHARKKYRADLYIEAGNRRKYPLTSLSSGERQVLTMLFSATRMSTTAPGVFLIDEPELSLHVDWQRIILGTLMAQASDRQIIACTHSPEVGADHSEAVQIFSPVVSVFESSEPGADDEALVMDDTV